MAAEGRLPISMLVGKRMLQWGRGRMAAEGARARGAWLSVACFNGAAAGWPRKDLPAADLTRYTGSFNGAAAGWPRKAA